MPSTAEILADPVWLPHVYDPAQDRLLFAHVPLVARKALTFLADHKPSGQGDAVWISAQDVREAPIASVPVHFVFHSAFCRSTLLVQALGALDGVIGLSEPAVLNTLQSSAGSPQARSLLGPVMRFLGRPIAGERLVVVKPSNFANGLIPALLRHNPAARGLVLYGLLRPFVRSIARKGLAGRLWGRKQLAHCRQIMPLELGMDERAFYELSDLQTAALAWLMQANQFAHLLRGHGAALRSLETDCFMADKAGALAATARLFGDEEAADSAATVAAGDLFASHAKLGGDYSAIRAEQEAAAISPVIEEEVEQVAGWIEVIQSQLDLALPLPAPLLA